MTGAVLSQILADLPHGLQSAFRTLVTSCLLAGLTRDSTETISVMTDRFLEHNVLQQPAHQSMRAFKEG